ncbi:unnamed protein product, partial [marine sediment metagenome]
AISKAMLRISSSVLCSNSFRAPTKYKTASMRKPLALKGQSGLDINNPDIKYTLNSLAGEFTGLQLVSYMYVGFNKIAPDQDIGVDLSDEYNMALKLFGSEDIQ